MLSRPTGQANLTAIAVLLGTVIAGVWVWKRLSLETQDYILDETLPMAVLAAIGLLVVWGIGRSVHRRKDRLRRRASLLARFSRETTQEQKLETAFALIEANEYRVEGLESVVCHDVRTRRRRQTASPTWNGGQSYRRSAGPERRALTDQSLGG
jgi:predicted membrane protein